MEGNNDILSIKTKILKVLNSQINEPITKEAIDKNLREELGVNTSKMDKIIFMLEKLYHIPILEEDLENLNTVNDIVVFIEERMQKKYIVKQHANTDPKD